jgi:hypothetical protein
MNQAARFFFITLGLFLFILAALFFIRYPLAVASWPWPDRPLSFTFISSILAASGASILWIGLSAEIRSAAAGAATVGIIALGSSLQFLRLYLGSPDSAQLLVAAVAGLIVFAFNLAVFFWARRYPLRDTRPIPALVRLSFIAFAAILVLAGGRLVFAVPDTMPWPLDPRSSVIFGWIFLGACVYFLFAFLEPAWAMVQGQLYGFLAYDLVLIAPFILHFADVLPQQRLSLTIYTIVLIYSGLLSVYYLFLNPKTRTQPNLQASIDSM